MSSILPSTASRRMRSWRYWPGRRPARKESWSSGRPVAIGATSTGRTILVVYDEIDEYTVYPVTAYDLED